MKLIDQDTETFKRGPFANESIYEVADEYPDYIKDILEGNKADADDRELLEPLVTNLVN